MRELQVVNELLVETARFAARQNFGSDLELGIPRRKRRRREPRKIDARQFNLIGDGDAPLGGDRRRDDRRLRDFRAARERPEIFLHEPSRVRGIEIAGNYECRIVGPVVTLEKIAYVGQPGGLNIGMRTHDCRSIRMTLGKQTVEQRFIGDAVRTVFHRFAPLVADNVLLVGERLLIERVQQIAHPIGVDPQAQL